MSADVIDSSPFLIRAEGFKTAPEMDDDFIVDFEQD